MSDNLVTDLLLLAILFSLWGLRERLNRLITLQRVTAQILNARAGGRVEVRETDT